MVILGIIVPISIALFILTPIKMILILKGMEADTKKAGGLPENINIDTPKESGVYEGRYFSLEYPKEWSLEERPASQNSMVLESLTLRISKETLLWVSYNNQPYEEAVRIVENSPIGGIEYFYVGGREAVRRELQDTDVFIPIGHSIIEITVKGTEDTNYYIQFDGDRNDTSDVLINTILDSIEFTPEHEPPSTEPPEVNKKQVLSDLIWKDYKDDNLGISFSYPDNLTCEGVRGDTGSSLRVDLEPSPYYLARFFIVQCNGPIVYIDYVKKWEDSINSWIDQEERLLRGTKTEVIFKYKPAYFYEVTEPQQIPTDLYILKHKDILVTVAVMRTEENAQFDKAVVSKIVDSIKFY